jgi:SAM-dependent methyltransferase
MFRGTTQFGMEPMPAARTFLSGRRRPRPTRLTTAPPEGSCLVCQAPALRRRTVTSATDSHKSRDVNVCPACGYVAIDELSVDRYRGKTSIDELPGGGPRIGTQERRGREFHMGRMAVEILGRDGVDVLVYGAGRSMDNHHLAALEPVREVAIGDIMRVRDDAPFHDANLPATRTFDVVVASEVIEHFRTPHEDFAKLFQFVAEDGLLVCGTSIKDGSQLAKHPYIFYPDHTSYYTPRALQIIAHEHGFRLDFRSPQGAGQRKRYVLFSRSAAVLEQVAVYFGTRAFAPSEATHS